MWNRLVAILVIVGTLALIPAVALAQMGPRQWMEPGKGVWMSPAGRPGMQGQEETGRTPERPTPERAAPTGTLGMEGMTGAGMEHPTPSTPFYRERTFLVLVGVAMTAAALFAYRVTRSRARRRRGPASFVTEAVLVVDLVDSTYLATHYGNGLAMQARTTLKDRTLAAAKGHGLAFAEYTGDGYFMTFPSAVDAVQAAIALLQDLRDRPPDLSPGPPLELRAGISFGEILLDGRGIRHGAVINRAFRLEGLTPDRFAQLEGGIEREAIPERNRIFLDEEAAQELRPAAIPLRSVGFCSLKGFSGLHRVYEVLWEAQD